MSEADSESELRALVLKFRAAVMWRGLTTPKISPSRFLATRPSCQSLQHRFVRLLLLGSALLIATAASAVNIDWVTVGDAGNACDMQPPRLAGEPPGAEGEVPGGCFGEVANAYRISKYEITIAQYAEFLNAVAATDTHGLYASGSGITRSGSSGSFSYAAFAGRDFDPANTVSWYDSLRFVNWLHNGQPIGDQDSTTTEGGAYTFSGGTSVGSRNPGATIFLPSEDEWYKAAYFNGSSYFDYPTGTDTPTGCAPPGAAANTANCDFAAGGPTETGSYTGSHSPYGTFDQGGNVWEWNEANEAILGSNRGQRGGSFFNPADRLTASYRDLEDPSSRESGVGFRVTSLPEPSSRLLQMTALLVVITWRRLQGR